MALFVWKKLGPITELEGFKENLKYAGDAAIKEEKTEGGGSGVNYYYDGQVNDDGKP